MNNREMTILETSVIESKFNNYEVGSLCAVEFYDKPNNSIPKKLIIRIEIVPELIRSLERFLNHLMQVERRELSNNPGNCQTEFYSYIEDIRKSPPTPGKAIYKHCSICQGGYVHGVTPCYNETCALFPYRPSDGTDHWFDTTNYF